MTSPANPAWLACLPGRFMRRRWRRMIADRSGASVVEFAIVAPIFLGLLLSIFELGATMTRTMLLESALTKTVRELRVGRPEGFTHAYVKQRLCDLSIIYGACGDNIQVELLPVPLGEPVPETPTRCVDEGPSPTPVVAFDIGARSELMFIRACIRTHIYTPGLALGLALDRSSDGYQYISAQSAFINEPS